MKKLIVAIVLSLSLASFLYATDSPKGGSVVKGEGFKIDVPTFDVKVKQGETQTIDIQLQRGDSFKQDVTLDVKLTNGKGLTFDPAKVVVMAGDKPDVQLRIKAPKDAILGKYMVSVTGTPATGEATSVEFAVKVVTPDAGYTMKTDSPQGGGTAKGDGFKISVPAFETKLKQGETQSVNISLNRGEAFKQNVTLAVKLSSGKGLILDPAKVDVKAGDKPDVQILIKAPKDAAVGEYKISVTGTPATGAAASTEFKVKVISPKDEDSSMQSENAQDGKDLKGEGFNIAVPVFDTKIKQGETQTVALKINRGDAFKQDVTLNVKLSKGEGLTFNPGNVLVKAGDSADVQMLITAPKDAALGEYKVLVTATPTTGEMITKEINVKVISPKDGYTIKSGSPKGGGTLEGEEFTIAVPVFDTKIKQGETQTVALKLHRGDAFKQDVTLEMKLTNGQGITIDPAKVIIKAEDKPDVQLQITALKDAALGEYVVSVTAAPAKGEPTSTEFTVKVVAP